MVGQNAVISILIKVKDELSKGLDKAKGSMQKFKKAAAGMAIAGGVVAAGMWDATKSAADAQETFSKFDTVFKDVSSGAENVAQDLRNNWGLAESSAKDLLSGTGDLLTGFGFTGQAALDLSEKTNKLAIDLASFTNFSGGAKGASEALTKALLGERESVKSLGIAILEKDVKAKIEAMEAAGRFTDETDRQKKALATLEIAVEQSKNAIGDYARTSDSAANQMRVTKERIKEAKEAFGAALLPVLEKVLPVIQRLLQAFIDSPPWIKTTIAIIGGLVVILGVLAVVVTILNAVMSPITLIILAIIAAVVLLIAIIKLTIKWFNNMKENIQKWKDALVNAWEAVGNAFKKVWNGIKNFFVTIWNSIIGFFENGINFFLKAINGVIKLINKIPGINMGEIGLVDFSNLKGNITSVDDAIIKPGGQIIKTNPNDTLIATQNPGGLGGGMVININNVNGLDPDEVANALQRALNDKIRR